MTTLYAAPFTAATTSYLFLDVPKSSSILQNSHLVNITNGIYSIEFWYVNDLQGRAVVTSVTTRQGDKVVLNSTVELIIEAQPFVCHPPIVEDARLWVQGDKLLLWSCVDLKDTGDRDEALLILYFDPESSGALYGSTSTEADLKAVAKKFISNDLLQNITMDVKRDSRFYKRGFFPFPCPNSFAQIPIYVPLLIMFVLFLGIFGGCWYLN